MSIYYWKCLIKCWAPSYIMWIVAWLLIEHLWCVYELIYWELFTRSYHYIQLCLIWKFLTILPNWEYLEEVLYRGSNFISHSNFRNEKIDFVAGCGCQYSAYGCCPDNITAARGPDAEGCGCQYTKYGCCPNGYTPAAGPEFKGCPCYTYQFGCCPDGVNVAKGPYNQGVSIFM